MLPNKLLIAHKSRLLFTYNADFIRDKTSLEVSIGRRLIELLHSTGKLY